MVVVVVVVVAVVRVDTEWDVFVVSNGYTTLFSLVLVVVVVVVVVGRMMMMMTITMTMTTLQSIEILVIYDTIPVVRHWYTRTSAMIQSQWPLTKSVLDVVVTLHPWCDSCCVSRPSSFPSLSLSLSLAVDKYFYVNSGTV